MEETQNQPQDFSQEVAQPQESKVSFPTVGGEKKSGGAKTFLIIGILVLVGVLGYVIYKSASGKSSDMALTEPTPYDNMAAPVEETTPESLATPSSSPSATVDKEDIKVQVQNGTGITGEAAYLQTLLKGLGYTDIAVGNSVKQDMEETQVSFGSSVPSSIVTEITTKLNSVYEKVTKTSSTSTTYDIVIITGLRKGATPKATATPTASASPTPTATPTSTPSN